MIILIHGEDNNKSLDFLRFLIKDHPGWQVLKHDLKSSNVNLEELVSTDTLFAENKLVVLENFYKSKRKIDFRDLKNNKQTKIVIFENNQLSVAQIAKLPKDTKIYLFKPEPLVFQFFDQLYPGNQAAVFKLFDKVKNQVDSQFFFAMFVKHFKYLILSKNDIGNIKLPLADWQIKKYKSLGARFSQGRLISAYQALFKIDIKLKTGEINNSFTPLSLLLLELTRS